MAKVIDSTNVGRLVSDIKAKADSEYWHSDDTIEVSLATVATTGSYNDLTDKPTAATGALIYMGTCGTAAGTATKVVTVETFPLQNSLPIVGTVIGVKFSNSNTASTPKLDVNNIGAKSIYYNAASVSSTSVTYGGSANRYVYYVWDGTYWVWLNHGTEANDNSLGYTVRTNATRKTVSGACYRYRILFTSADGTKWVPSNTSSSTNATASRTVNQTKIDPFGPIAYYATTTALSSGGAPSASYLYQQYASLTLGYSFNRTGAALVLTTQTPVWIKCAPQTDGSAIIDSDTPYVQALPSTADGKIYILLGNAIAATTVELLYCHPVYYFADGAIRLWTNGQAQDTSNFVQKSNTAGLLKNDGTVDTTSYGTYSKPSGGIPASDLASGVIPTVPVTDVTVGGTSVVSNGTAVVPAIPSAPGSLDTTATTAQSTSASEALSGSVTLHKVAKTGTYSDLIGKPTIPSAPGTLNTNNTTAQTASSSEALSGAINLHQVSKTGSYNDLLNKPTIPTDVVKYTSQSLTDSQKAQARANIGATEQEVFIAIRDVTTYSEITNAINSGKYVVAKGIVEYGEEEGEDPETQFYVGFRLRPDEGVYYFSRVVYDEVEDSYTMETIAIYGGDESYWSAQSFVPLESSIYKATDLLSPNNVTYPTTKLVYDEIHPAVGSSQPAGGMLPNVFYNLGTLSGNTTFSFASASDANIVNEWMFQFTTPSTAPTITWPNAITGWLGGNAPTIAASKTYQVSVVNGLGVIAEF